MSSGAARPRGAARATPRSPGALDRAIGARLKAARRAKGYTQERLASELGVSYQQVQKYESGASRMPTERLQAAAELLSIALGALIGRDDVDGFREPQVGYAPELVPAWDVRRLTALLRRIEDAGDRFAVQRLIERLAGDAVSRAGR